MDSAVALFAQTEKYYERPFKPSTTLEGIKSSWQDIKGLEDIRLEFSVIAIEGQTACIHWENWFRTPGSADLTHLDGVFRLDFDEKNQCKVFRQWWFMEPQI